MLNTVPWFEKEKKRKSYYLWHWIDKNVYVEEWIQKWIPLQIQLEQCMAPWFWIIRAIIM